MSNKIIKFSTIIEDEANYKTYNDNELNALVDKKGLRFGTVAFTDILNGLLRQTTHLTSGIGDLLAKYNLTDVNSSANILSMFEKTITTIGESKFLQAANPTVAPVNWITVNSSGLVTTVKALIESDIPTLSIGKIQNLGTELNKKVNNTLSIAGNTLTSNISRDQLVGINSGVGLLKRTSTNTYVLDSTVYIPQNTAVGKGTLKTTGVTIDSILGLTTVGIVRRRGANDYYTDTSSYALTSNTLTNVDNVKWNFKIASIEEFNDRDPDQSGIIWLTYE